MVLNLQYEQKYDNYWSSSLTSWHSVFIFQLKVHEIHTLELSKKNKIELQIWLCFIQQTCVGISMAIQFKHAPILCCFLKSLPCISLGPLGYIFYLFSDVKYILFNSFPQIFRDLSSSLLNSKLIWKCLCHYIESLDRMSVFFLKGRYLKYPLQKLMYQKK